MQLLLAEVSQALSTGRAVVALESTLIAQGLPWPENLETALEAEQAVRAAGAVPATIGVLQGVVHIGLTRAELEHVAQSGDFAKASRRDLGWAVARGIDAATTVSATLWLAQRQSIGVLATGGLGGVHRDAATSFDVSTDLDELARAAGMLVVCSGIKSILDMPATLEALETRGVPVVGYQTGTLPAFTTRTSDLALEMRVETPAEAAALVRAHRALGLPSAVVLTQQVPEHVALDRQQMEAALAQGLAEAQRQNIRGKALTPYLLEHLREATGGRSLAANRALIVANAGLAAEIAVALSEPAS
jgi:pseudouridylate synthase